LTKYRNGADIAVNDVFRALADPTRREILRLLRKGDKSAGEIADRFPLAASTMSGHFKVLKHAGSITAERKATAVVYSLNVPAAEESVGVLREIFKVGHAPQPTRES
jgi:DNA-binding transcriptional ArsR family regulator